MPDKPTWEQIYATRPVYAPVTPRLDVPRVPKPRCPEHCSGKHDMEGTVYCPHCKVPAYQVRAHEWNHQEGHYFYELVPMNGSPPSNGKTPVCNCGRTMIRTL